MTKEIKPKSNNKVGVTKPTDQGRRTVRSSAPTSRDLEKALETLKALGFKVEPPSSMEEKNKQKASLKKLGFKGANNKVKEETPKGTIKIHLGTSHYVSGNVYGPGDVVLDRGEVSLINSLLHQDQLAKSSHMDTRQYQPVSRCFLIKNGNDADKHNKFRKVEVSEALLNSDRIWEEVTITAGNHDIAGYNPSFGIESRGF